MPYQTQPWPLLPQQVFGVTIAILSFALCQFKMDNREEDLGESERSCALLVEWVFSFVDRGGTEGGQLFLSTGLVMQPCR